MARLNREDYKTAIPQLSDAVDKLDAKTRDLFYSDRYTKDGVNFSANEYKSLEIDYTPRDGYTAFITYCACPNKTAPRVTAYSISGAKIYVDVVNTSGSSVSGANFSLRVLHIKTELKGTE